MHFIPWLTGSEWHCIFLFTMVTFIPWPTDCKWHCIFPYHEVLLHFTPWPTESEQNCIFSLLHSLIASHHMAISLWVALPMQSRCFSFHGQQGVSNIAFVFNAVSLHFISWSPDCEWHFSLPCSQCHCISSHDHRLWVTLHSLCSLIAFHPQDVSGTAVVFLYLAVSFSGCYKQFVSDISSAFSWSPSHYI